MFFNGATGYPTSNARTLCDGARTTRGTQAFAMVLLGALAGGAIIASDRIGRRRLELSYDRAPST